VGDAAEPPIRGGKHVRDQLQLLPKLLVLLAFDPRLELVKGFLQRKLCRRAGVTMHERDITGAFRFDRQRKADQATLHRVKARVRNIDRRKRRSIDLGDPCFELRLVKHVSYSALTATGSGVAVSATGAALPQRSRKTRRRAATGP